MSRIAATFQQLAIDRTVAIMSYLTVGFPERDSTLDLVPALEAAGANLFELGVPFSDPLADGATVQKAGERALRNGVNLPFCLDSVTQLRERGVSAPLLLMGYCNPFLRFGVSGLCAELAARGGDGLIVPDMPPSEAHALHAACQANALDLIFFVAPTSTDERIAQAARLGSGFLYCVALAGVTGARSDLAADLGVFLERVRRHTDLPLVVGFGISRPEHIAEVARYAEGAIVGSALISLLDQLPAEQRVEGAAMFVRGLRGSVAAPAA